MSFKRVFMLHVLMANPTDYKRGSSSDSDTEVDSSPDSSEDSGQDVDKLKGLSSQKGPPNFDQRKPWTPKANIDPPYLKLDSEGETISLYTRQPVHSTINSNRDRSVADEDCLQNINQAGGVRENEGSQFGTLSCDDLTMDARACAKPISRRKKQKAEKTKGDKIKSGKKTYKDTFDHFETEDKAKSSSKRSDTDIEELIKQLVLKKTSQRNEIVFFDAAIVYDKNDYDYVVAFREEIVQMVKSSLGEDVRIELFDSEVFAQSKIMVVQDVINRCSVVFLYLTENFNSPELHFFVEEAVGISRLELGSSAESSAETASKRWALKPVHTMPPKSRKYPTPLGLVSVNGIDWYDRHSEHTKSKIIAVMKAAVVERKQRSQTVNVLQRSAEMFGPFTHMPPLGPPFNKPITDPQRSLPAVPNKQDPLISQHSVDALSFPSGYADPPKRSVRSESIPPLHPSYTEIPPPYAFNCMGQQYRTNQVGMQMNQVPYQYIPQVQASLAYQLPAQTGIYQSAPYQSAGLQNQSNFQNFNPELNQHLQYPLPTGGQQYPSNQNLAASPVATYQGIQQQLDARQTALSQYQQQRPNDSYLSQLPPYQQQRSHNPYLNQTPPYQQQRSHDPYLNQHVSYPNQPMSRDALQSEPGNYLLDQRHDTPSRSQLSVVSRVNGQLITNPNLSTDDVEVDNLTEVLGDTSQASKKSSFSKSKGSDRSKKYRTAKEHLVKQDGSDDSDYSSSDSGYSTVIVKKKPVKEKVYNFVGCRIVQMGKGNKVTESGRKMRSAYPKSGRPDLKEKEIEEVSANRNRAETTPDNKQCVSEASTKDAMSMHKTSSKNLLAVDVRKPALNKAIVLEETGSNSVHLSDSGNGNPQSIFNRLNSVAHSSEHQKSEEGRIFQMKMNFSSNDSYQQQDGAQSSMEDNRFTSEELNISSEDQLFCSGSLDARMQTMHEDKIPCFTLEASSCSVHNEESEEIDKDKKACFAFSARREILISKFSKCDYQKQNLRSLSEDTDEVD